LTAKIVLLLIALSIAFQPVKGQPLSFKDTVAAYSAHRIHTNKKGMIVLGSWGIANIAGSGYGYFSATKNEWKYFHEMNVLWGVVNAGIAGFGLSGVRKDMNTKHNYEQSYDRFQANKKTYLINAGLDVLYIGAGIGMYEYGASATTNGDMFKGFGRSFIIQGVFLLLFDDVMYASHMRYDTRWFRIMSEIRVTNNGIGFSHTF
jgi:hypothetical protein